VISACAPHCISVWTPVPVEREAHATAILAANVALTGRRRREASSFASIELRAEDPKGNRWELMAALVVGFAAVVAVLVAWAY
jgi:hypothetical protein